MPFIYDQTQVELPDDDSELPPPRADQFVYFPASEFGGGREPVRFSVPSLGDVVEPAEPPHVAQPHQEPAPTTPPRRGILDRLLRWSRPLGPPQPSSFQERQRESQRMAERRIRRLFAVIKPALREIGAQRIYCRYDGGNDEGFALLGLIVLRWKLASGLPLMR
jgi:hypothetical protein